MLGFLCDFEMFFWFLVGIRSSFVLIFRGGFHQIGADVALAPRMRKLKREML
jgi:hypothetical protein